MPKRVAPHLKQIPSPGTGFVLNVESLMALKPDLVVTWDRKPDQVGFFWPRGLTVVTLYLEGLADLLSGTRELLPICAYCSLHFYR